MKETNTALGQWTNLTKKKQKQRISFSEAIFNGKWGKYLKYRLSYFLINSFASQIIHLIECFILIYLLDKTSFKILVFFKLLNLSLGHFWWGYLENYRNAIRELRSNNAQIYIPQYLNKQLQITFTFLVLVLFSQIFFYFTFIINTQSIFLKYYIISSIILFSLQIITTTIHSTVYAIRRIYRPLSSILILEIISFLIIILLFPIIEEWALIFASSTSALLSIFLRLYYCKNAFHELKIKNVKKIVIHNNRFFFKESLLSGLSNTLIRLDSIFILTFFTPISSYASKFQMNYFLSIYLILPILQSNANWSRLMYFDFVKYSDTLLENFIVKLFKKTIIAGFIVSFLYTLFSLLVFFFSNQVLDYFFILAISLYLLIASFYQIILILFFSKHQYKKIIYAALPIYLMILLNFIIGFNTNFIILSSLCFSISIIYSLFILRPFKIENKKGKSDIMSFLMEINNSIELNSPLIIGESYLSKESTSLKNKDWIKNIQYYLKQIIKDINHAKKNIKKSVFIYPAKLVFISKTSNLTAIDSELTKTSLGLFMQSKTSQYNLADLNSIKQNILYILVNKQANSKKIEKNTLIQKFASIIKNGKIINLENKELRNDDFENLDKSRLLKSLSSYFENFYYDEASSMQIDAFFPKNNLMLIFIYSKHERNKEKWQNILKEQNILNTLSF